MLSSPQAKQACGEETLSGRGRPVTDPSDVKVAHLARLGLDEGLAGPDLLAHQHREDLVRLDGVVDADAQEGARPGSIVVSQSWSAFISPRPL